MSLHKWEKEERKKSLENSPTMIKNYMHMTQKYKSQNILFLCIGLDAQSKELVAIALGLGLIAYTI